MAVLHLTDEVRAALGGEAVANLTAMLDATARCAVCQQPLLEQVPVSVLVTRSATTMHVSFAHPVCAPSSVRQVPEEVMTAAVGAEHDMTMSALVLGDGGRQVPVLVAEMPAIRAWYGGDPAGGAELTNMMVAFLLQEQFALVSRLREAPRATAAWETTIGPVGERGSAPLRMLARGGEMLFYGGTVHLPQQWSIAAQRLGWCVLYAGTVQLPASGPAAACLTALRDAAATGGLVGARLPLTWASS